MRLLILRILRFGGKVLRLNLLMRMLLIMMGGFGDLFRVFVRRL